MINRMFTIAALTAASTAFCALPPWAQEAKELDDIKNHEEFLNLLDGDPGDYTITKTDDGYRIETENFVMDVHVEYHPDGTIGPAKYSLEFDLPQMKEQI